MTTYDRNTSNDKAFYVGANLYYQEVSSGIHEMLHEKKDIRIKIETKTQIVLSELPGLK